MPTTLKILVMRDGRIHQRCSFTTCSVMLGRSEQCQVVLNEPGVSRVHAEISQEIDAYYLNDLGSANGTALNGIAQTRIQLHDGDVITIGTFELLVTIPAEMAPSDARVSPTACTERTVRAPASKKHS